MKRGKKTLIYIFSVLIASFCIFVFSSKVEALDDSAFVTKCLERETFGECVETTQEENAYFVLEKINVGSESLTELVIPSTSTITIGSNTITANIEVIGDGENELIDANEDLMLTSLTLPSYLREINTYALHNIQELNSLTLPTSLELISSSIFQEGSIVNNIYLNHYEVSAIKQLSISTNAFNGVELEKIICGNTPTYNYFAIDLNNLLHLPFVVKVTYNFYPSEKETITDGKSEVSYYVGKDQVFGEDTFATPKDMTSEGLTFKGWYLKKTSGIYEKIEELTSVVYIKDTLEYNVYPRYALNEVAFEIVAKDVRGDLVSETNIISYNGGDKIGEIMTSNLIFPVGYNKTYTWYKGSVNDNSIVSTEEKIDLRLVKQSGLYILKLDCDYTSTDGVDYSSTSWAQTVVNIEKAKLSIVVKEATTEYGTYLTDDDIKYTAIGLLKDDYISSDEFEYMDSSYGHIDANLYNSSIKVKINVISDGVNDDKISNYSIVESPGNYRVTKKVIDVTYEGTVEYFYGDEIKVRKLYTDNNVYGKYNNSLVISFAVDYSDDIGPRNIRGVKAISDTEGNSNDNYSINYINSNGQVIVNPKPIDIKCSIDGQACDENNNVTTVYTGDVKNLKVYYEDAKGFKVDVPYRVTLNGNPVEKIVNANDEDSEYYIIYIESLTSNKYTYSSDVERTIMLKVDKALQVPVYSTRQVFTYTGEKINPVIKIANDEQKPDFYCNYQNLEGNYCINNGTYNVKVVYPETENYKESVVNNIILVIDQLIVNVTPKEFTFPYNSNIVGNVKETIKVNGEDVEISYSISANNNSNIGSYNITGGVFKDNFSSADHPNYRASINSEQGKGKIKIVKRKVDIVYYDYENLIYNGKERVVGAYAIDQISKEVVKNIDINVMCDEGKIKDAKTYHLRAYFESDYYEIANTNLLVFSIGKATYDLSHVKFNNQSFTLDFKDHAINIDGELPSGVEVEYSIDGEKGNSTSKGFTHTVVAKFIVDENNYFPVDSIEATIHIDVTWVFITSFIVLVVIAIAFILAWMYIRYRRKHPKKIKLKIKDLVDEDLAAKRVATSVKEVLGDDTVEGEHIEDEDDIIEGNGIDKNFIDRIYATSSEVKYYYSEVKNELLSYEGVSHGVDRKYEVFYHGTRQIAKLSICNGVLRLYVNLDPQKYDKKQYNHRDMSKIELHARTPLRLDVNTTESLRHAKVFIRILRKKENLKSASSFVRIDYEKFYTLKENVFPKIFKKMFNIKNKKAKK